MQKLLDTRVAFHLPVLAATAMLTLPLCGVTFAQEVTTPAVTASHPTLNLDLRAAMEAPVLTAESSSSALPADPGIAASALPAAGDGSLQPPPYRRRRYGAPSYSDRLHNADGSSKIAAVVGGGFTIPTGSASSNYLNTGWRFEGGVGYNASRKFGVMAQFDWDNFGIPGSVLSNQEAIYNTLSSSNEFSGLTGHTHIWSFTLNPTFNFYQSDTLGAYAVVGGGFYHKVTNFAVPTEGEYCDYLYGCYTYQANQTIDSYTSNAPGVTGGIGVTYKFSRFANEKFFAEARFVHTFNQARLGDPTLTGNSAGTAYNLYPPNSNETSYIPITFGIRF